MISACAQRNNLFSTYLRHFLTARHTFILVFL